MMLSHASSPRNSFASLLTATWLRLRAFAQAARLTECPCCSVEMFGLAAVATTPTSPLWGEVAAQPAGEGVHLDLLQSHRPIPSPAPSGRPLPRGERWAR